MSKTFPLLWLSLFRRRRMLLALLLGIALFEILIIVISRSIPPEQIIGAKIGGSNSIPRTFQAFSGSNGQVSLATYAGLVGAGLVHPFWIAMQLTAIGSFGAAIVAADVEQGTIELLMVRPISRYRLLFERITALIIASMALNITATLAVAVGVALSPNIHQEISLSGVLVAGLMGFALCLSISGPVIAISAASSKKAQVVSAAVVIGAVGFAINFVALAWSSASFFRYLSPFHYYSPGDALVHNGAIPLGSLGVLLSISVIGIIAAVWLLQRRDLA